MISGNVVVGVYIDGSTTTANLVAGNFIGTDITGTLAIANREGVVISDGASNNTIGGLTTTPGTGAGNVISGNTDDGVQFNVQNTDSGPTDNLVAGNLVGTNAAGTAALGNGYDGVLIEAPATNNTIGGSTASALNIISGNINAGVEINHTNDDLVAGDYIGTDKTGTFAIGNATGVEIDTSASGNTIGGVTSTPGTGLGNVISGNTDNGVVIDGTGLPALTYLYLKADGNANNSGNNPNGVYVGDPTLLDGGVTYGTGVTGEAFQFNDTAGERVDVGDPANFLANTAVTLSAWINLSSLPGTTPYVIASRAYSATSENYGLYVNSSGELVFEWYSAGAFHTETSSGAALGSRLGVFQQVAVVTDGSTVSFYVNGVAVSSAAMPDPLDDSASGDLEIGGLSQGPNLFNGLIDEISVTLDPLPADAIARIYANAGQGTDEGGSGTQDTTVVGNLIGTNPTGTTAIPNGVDGVEINDAFNNTIGGGADDPSNIISGNTGDGVEITGTGATGNVVAGDFIGTDFSGTLAVANNVDGIAIDTGASGNTIGGTTTAACNIISGNLDAGVLIDDSNDNVVEGDYVGTDMTGKAALANGADGSGGILVQDSASANTIGGLTATPGTGAGNLISGNVGAGVVVGGAGPNNLVAGNLIGTDVTGSVALGNDYAYGSLNGGTGVQAVFSPDTIVGEPGGGNVIGGNGLGTVNSAEVNLYYSTGSSVQSNYIGTDATGTVALSTTTYYGVALSYGSYTVGGLTPVPGTGLGNVISGNGIYGITFRGYDAGDTLAIEGNIVGADPTGELAVPNFDGGIGLYGVSLVTIGGTAAGAGNLISGNDDYGSAGNVYLSDASNNVVEGNLIGTDMTGTAPVNASGVLSGAGVALADGSSDNTIGGTTAAAGNIISGNAGWGVYIGVYGLVDSLSSANVVEGNYIGTDKAGTAALANAYDGVKLGTGATGNTIGGTTVSARNIISGNGTDGVEIAGTGAYRQSRRGQLHRHRLERDLCDWQRHGRRDRYQRVRQHDRRRHEHAWHRPGQRDQRQYR